MTALVDVATYRWITGDETTPSASVERELAAAQQMADEHCKRTFEYGTYTETLDIYRNGAVYPKASPVASVSDPTGAALRFGGIYLGASGPWPDALSPLPPQSTVTYTGGYHPYGSGTTPELPVKLMRVICRIAYLTLHPSSLIGSGVPAGAKAASVGDVSVAGDLSGLIAIDSSIEKDLRRFVRRRPAQLARS